LIVVLGLLFLEWLFWMSPLKGHFASLTRSLWSWHSIGYYIFPYHYLARIAFLSLVLSVYRVELWTPLMGGRLALSLGVGLAVSALLVLLSTKGSRRGLKVLLRLHRKQDLPFWLDKVYLFVYPGLMEELIFRWVLLAVLWPLASWWSIAVMTVYNLIWHLPVWTHQFGPIFESRGRALILILPAAALSILLGCLAVITHNLLGAVLIHGVADWLGSIQQSLVFPATQGSKEVST